MLNRLGGGISVTVMSGKSCLNTEITEELTHH